MALQDLIVTRPQVAYLFPELDPAQDQSTINLFAQGSKTNADIFVFQYWPTQVQDSYQVEYATKIIPGGSHPIYQWIAGNGRTISFEAIFTAEVEDTTSSALFSNGTNTGLTLLPSSRYTVNVGAAINKLQSYQYPTYGKVSTKPPPKLRLVLPGSRIGRSKDVHDILCFLKSSRVTFESSFPSGAPRVATVALEFVETVQAAVSSADSTRSSIKFIDRSAFSSNSDYRYGSVSS